MHDAPTYGRLLTADGKPMTTEALARRVGETPPRTKRLLDELLTNGVGRRAEDGAIESPRMIRDEDRRNKRAAGGKLGGNPELLGRAKDNGKVNLPRGSEVNAEVNQKQTPAVAVASASELQDQQQKDIPRGKHADSQKRAPTWLTPARDAWDRRFGSGAFNCGKAARDLGRLYQAGLTPDEIAVRLGNYLDVKRGGKFHSLSDFAEHHGEYAGPLHDGQGALTPLGERVTRPREVVA